jgi:hypothetical protein
MTDAADLEFEELIENLDYLYQRSYMELQKQFREGFRQSIYYSEMEILLNQNMIEYRFMRQAGLLHQNN